MARHKQYCPGAVVLLSIALAAGTALGASDGSGQGGTSLDCVADCDGDGTVTISELLLAVRGALEEDAFFCLNADADVDGAIGIGELIRGANASLHRCSHRCGDSLRALSEVCEYADPFPVFCGTCRIVREDGRVRVGDYTCNSQCNCDVPESSNCRRY